MVRRTPSRPWKLLASEEGFTLLEAIAALALTAAISTVITSLIISMLSNKRALQDQTDLNDSLRTPAAMIMRDVRYARSVACSPYGDSLTVNFAPAGSATYQFLGVNPSDPSQPSDLHRTEGVEDVVIASGLLPTVPYSDDGSWLPPNDPSAPPQTWFECNPLAWAHAHLELAPIGAQSRGASLEVWALRR